jgi:hypothetical protein
MVMSLSDQVPCECLRLRLPPYSAICQLGDPWEVTGLCWIVALTMSRP